MDKNESKLNEDATIGITALAKIVTYIAWTGLFISLLFYLADKADINLIPKKIDPFLLIFAIGISISLAIVITFPLALNETKQKNGNIERQRPIINRIYARKYHSSNRVFNFMPNHATNPRFNCIIHRNIPIIIE